MTVEVLWFASLADRTGTRREEVETEGIPDVAGLWELLVERHPALRSIGIRPVAACDRRRVAWSESLEGVREVAFLPPVSGG